MYINLSLFSREYLAPIAEIAWPMKRTESSTMRELNFLPLVLMSPWQYSAANLARIRMGSLCDKSSGSRATLAQKAEHIFQWLSAESALEVKNLSALASVAVWKLHRKCCCRTWSTCAMAVAGGNRCQSGVAVWRQ